MEYIAYGPPDLEANVTTLEAAETQVFRCDALDSVCLAAYLVNGYLIIYLTPARSGLLLLSPKLPKYTYIFGASAWWVHTGETHRSVYKSVPT